MKTSRCLGLVGGLGVGATIHYYRMLAAAHEAQSRALDIVIAHAETPRVFEYVGANDRNGLARYLNGYIRRLEAAGAEVVAIPAVTPHFCVRELIAISPLPLLNIFEPLVRDLRERKAKRVAVFGTKFVMESALFGELKGVEVIPSRPHEANYIHDAYVQLAQSGKGSEEQHKKLTSIAQTLIKRDGVDAIVLAGTDLAILFNDTNTDFPHVNCAALHLRQILKELLGVSATNAR